MTQIAQSNSNSITDEMVLEVEDLKMYFPITRGFWKRHVGDIRAVDKVSFFIRKRETLGLVGESGCGKTTTGRAILRAYNPTDGEIRYHKRDGTVQDLANLSRHEMKPYRREIRMIFQDPYLSLNPRMNLLHVIGEPLKVNGLAHGKELEDRVAALLKRVGLRPEYLRRYPHAFSGGERQRIGIARAIATNPRLVVADEAVSALDVSVRAQVLNLMEDLQEEYDLTYLFVAHDLSVVQHICDRVAVMYLGKIVELAETDELYNNPQMPYTEALMSAVPRPDPDLRGKGQRIVLQGEVPDPANAPPGCHFHTRCSYAQDRCKTEVPKLREVTPGHFAACHFSEELNLRGVTPEEMRQ